MTALPLLAAAWVQTLPSVNAGLNLTATVLLIIGYALIKQGREQAHKATMLAAFVTSILFLTCYLIYHYHVLHVRFTGPPAIRFVYLVILFSHIGLAVLVPFLAVATIYLGLTNRRVPHRRLARWTFPIWLYVSITGVVVYWMLYHLFPAESQTAKITEFHGRAWAVATLRV